MLKTRRVVANGWSMLVLHSGFAEGLTEKDRERRDRLTDVHVQQYIEVYRQTNQQADSQKDKQIYRHTD